MRKNSRAAICAALVLGGCLALFGPALARGDEESAKATLSGKGIRVSHTGFTVPGETEFVKAVSAASALRRKLSAESGQEQSTESGDEESAARIETLTQQNVALKQRLTELNQVGFAFRGQMVQQTKNQIAANDREIARLQGAQKQSTKLAEGTRKDAKSGREAYHKQVSDARAQADQLIAEYSTLNHDKGVAAAVKEYNQAAHVSHKLAPSHSFESAVRRLEALEQKIVSGKVPLRMKDGASYATATINGVTPCEMQVDPKVATLVLPYQVAVDAGIHVDAAPESTVSLADGSQADAKRVHLKSVRLGSFAATNVLCDVLPASNKTAQGTLGLSFLKHFKYEIDATNSELSLARAAAAGTHKKRSTTKHTTKKSSKTATPDEPTE